MNKFKYYEIIKVIAEKEGVSKETVIDEIQKAIDIGFTDKNKEIQEEWKNINFCGEKPTPQEMIEELCRILGEYG